MQGQFGQYGTVHREGLAKTSRERAVVRPKMLVFGLFRAISRQPGEHLAFGRRPVISLKSLQPNVCHGRTHSGLALGVFFQCAAHSWAARASQSFRSNFGIFTAALRSTKGYAAASPGAWESNRSSHVSIETPSPRGLTPWETSLAQRPTRRNGRGPDPSRSTITAAIGKAG
jgi:hypothetical protein